MTVSPAEEQLRLALQKWEDRSKHDRTFTAKNTRIRLRSRKGHPFEGVDLRKDSILWLSSSDDESEVDESMRSDIGSTIPGIRDSLIITSSDSSDAEIGTAHAIRTERPRLSRDCSRRKAQIQSSGKGESWLKQVQVPERTSSKTFSFLSDQSRSPSAPKESPMATSPITTTSSEVVGNYPRSPHTASRKHEGSVRIMAVTPQEESLLEAIRSKRISMRQSILAETFLSTSGGEQGGSAVVHLRPQTSGLEGNSASSSSSFLHLSQDSAPTVSTFHKHRRSISAGEVLEFNGMGPRTSGSTDPTSSHRGSFAHSSLPSTSGQESPPTPTLEPDTDNWIRRTGSNTQRYSTNYRRHTRVRTGSSEIIVLDGLDDGSSSHFKLDGLPIWTFTDWPNRPGISVVH